ncbi:MAG: cellulose synthase subunit BcsC-related outer membrane protein [Desulfobulbaceae bacterium]|nr:cellulose synthase subunit BcsC-related outer membrane protein [Desulfobulbaceae bacterium]
MRLKLPHKSQVLCLTIGMTLFSAATPLLAQGDSPTSSPTALSMPSNMITVRRFRVTGAETFSETRLRSLLDDAIGKKLSPADLESLGQRITDFYRDHGYKHAHAILPEQNFNEGVVRFIVVKLPSGTTNATKEPSPPTPVAINTAAGPAVNPPVNDAETVQRPATMGNDPIAALLERERLWESRHRLDLARESLEKIFLIKPDHPEALAALVSLEIKEGRLVEAHQAKDRLAKAHPDYPDIVRLETLLRLAGPDKDKLRQARLLARTGRPELALASFRTLFPTGPPTDADLALEYWQLVADTQNGWESAHNGLRQLATSNPDNLRLRLALAEHETSRLPIPQQALRVLVTMSQMPDYAREAKAAWRRALTRLDDTPSTIPLLREYLAKDSADTAMQERLAKIVREQEGKQRLLADPFYRAKVKGVTALNNGKLNIAEKSLSHALKGRPNDAEVLGGIGLLRLRQGRHAEAERYFSKALRLDPDQKSKWQSLVQTAKFWKLMQESSTAQEAKDLALAEQKIQKAIKIDPREAYAYARLGEIQTEAGMMEVAEQSFRRALAIDPTNSTALSGLIGLALQQKKTDKAKGIIANLSPTQRHAMGKKLNTLQAGMLRDEANLAFLADRQIEAINLLEQAVQIDQDNPWLRFDLARLYSKQGQGGKGQALFDSLLVRLPNDPESLYAQALFQSGEDHDLPALTTLEQIAIPERSASMTALQHRLWMKVQRERVLTLVRAGQMTAAKQLTSEIETAVAGDKELGTELAYLWAELGDSNHARQLLKQIKTTSTPLPTSWHLRYAGLLADNGTEEELQQEFKLIATSGALSADEVHSLARLRESAILRRVEALRQADQLVEAQQSLAPFLAASPDSPKLLMAQALLARDMQQMEEAEASYRAILALSPKDQEARKGLLTTLIETNQRDEALVSLEQWLSPSEQLDSTQRLPLIGFLLDLEEYAWARQELDIVLFTEANNSRALNHAWQLARHEGKADQAIDYLQRSLAADETERLVENQGLGLPLLHREPDPVTGKTRLVADTFSATPVSSAYDGNLYQLRSMAELLDSRTNWLSSALDWRTRRGTPGLSELDLLEIPIEWRTPWHRSSQLFFRTDVVTVNAGNLDQTDTYSVERFGSLLLCPPGCQSSLDEQKSQGASVTGGYEKEDLRLDLGTSPLGFPVWNLLGGILKKGDLGPLSYAMDLSRRPLTSSLLSYAGTHDPRTNEVWGGVVATGGSFGLSYDRGEAYGIWSSLGWHRLTGENVQDNNSIRLMAGTYWRVINETNRLFSVGLTGMAWQFSENAGEYTFGHGGYYSPQSYRSLALPITFGQRFIRFSYVLRGAVSTSWSETDAAPYFPSDSAMQSAAGNPFYTESKTSTGQGTSLHAGWEYQVDPKLFIGGRFEVERSQDYSPNRVIFYLRYALDHSAAKPVLLPPEPILPTSQF